MDCCIFITGCGWNNTTTPLFFYHRWRYTIHVKHLQELSVSLSFSLSLSLLPFLYLSRLASICKSVYYSLNLSQTFLFSLCLCVCMSVCMCERQTDKRASLMSGCVQQGRVNEIWPNVSALRMSPADTLSDSTWRDKGSSPTEVTPDVARGFPGVRVLYQGVSNWSQGHSSNNKPTAYVAQSPLCASSLSSREYVWERVRMCVCARMRVGKN